MTIRTIEVRENRGVIESDKHDITTMVNHIARMKKAGIPVIGNLTIRGVFRGAITIYPEGTEYVYSWIGDVPDDDGELL